MKIIWHFLSAFLTGYLLVMPAKAASTDWQSVEGAHIRLVVEDKANIQGMLKGALQIELEPGWKTYWREPGDAGIPPSIRLTDTQSISGLTVQFPAPQLFKDQWSTWAGYSGSVSFALEFMQEEPNDEAEIEIEVFLGVCEDICIPVGMNFAVGTKGNSNSSNAIVANAFAKLPKRADVEFGVQHVEFDGDELVIEAAVPDNQGLQDLFLAPPAGWIFSHPNLMSSNGNASEFRAKVITRPTEAASGNVAYTLTAGALSVSGAFDLND